MKINKNSRILASYIIERKLAQLCSDTSLFFYLLLFFFSKPKTHGTIQTPLNLINNFTECTVHLNKKGRKYSNF